jgi:hypothetical protein
MTCRRSSLLLLAIAALFLTPTLALAAPPAPQPSTVAVAQPLLALSTATPACQGTADLLVLSPAAQAIPADDTSLLCGACSDAACLGKSPGAVCGGADLRCISGGPTCTTASEFRCRCLPIP